jgi:hypothetical protein
MAFYRKLVEMSPGARNHLQTVCILLVSTAPYPFNRLSLLPAPTRGGADA